ncbi:hypothetical protein KIW84_011062 [Lathyrus oleraceus]|uniref:Uncharacterized protein n=1 Tax=Pisum sativum TaxID=3888 RepID=A0A9D4YNJ8_PEA|nr:hypothetical protein KIW84_011062 [Pisum sativum]
MITVDNVTTVKTIAQEITGGIYEDWPHKGLLPTANLSVKPNIINSEDIVDATASPLMFSCHPFSRTHVPGMYLPNIHFDLTNEGHLPEVPQMFGIVKSNVLLELMQVSKSLHKVIVTSTTRKKRVDELIQMMFPKGVGASTTQPNGMDKTVEAQVGKDNGDVVSEGDSDVGSSTNFEY